MPWRPVFGSERWSRYPSNTSAEPAGSSTGTASSDQFHLAHRFARRYGMSPGRYRRMGSAAPSVLDDAGVRRLVNAVWGG